MIYDITRPTPPEMPTLGKGLETQRLLLSQTSKDMFQPEHPLLYAPLGAKISGAEFQYPSGQWLEPCGQIRLLCADSGNNKGQHSLLVEAIMREELRSDHEAINKYLEWQKAYKAANKRDKPVEQDLCIHVMPSDTTRPGYLKAQMAAEKHGGYTTFIDLPEAVMLDNLCGGHKQMTQILRLIHDRSRYQALRATADGITGSAILRTNISMASNPTDIRKFLKYNLLDGTLGRIAFTYKPRSEKRDPNIPVIGKFDEGFYQELNNRMAPLALCKGRYVIPQLNKVCKKLAAEICEYADLTDNDIMWDMAKRSIVASFKAGCVMWALNKMTWTRGMGDMVEWLTWYGIWSVWAVMGDMLKDGGDTGSAEGGKTGPANMLDSIEGNTFNEQQLDALRQQMGKSTGAASKKQLSVWAARGFIEYSAQTGLYTKTEKYLKGIKS